MQLGIFELISTLANVVLGGGLLLTMLTLRSQKLKIAAEAKQAEAVAEGSELENADRAARMWRENFVALNLELKESRARSAEMALQIDALRKEVTKLTRINNKIVELLNSSDHADRIFSKIKEELNK